MTETGDFIGRATAIDKVDIVARVPGFIDERYFTEGQQVKTGDLPFRIEQATYKGAVEQQRANLAKAKATEVNAAQQLGRGKELVRKQNIPQATVDQRAADEAAAQEQVNGIDNALYYQSVSGADGSYTLNVTFALGTDPDINTVNVENRASLATPQLPEEVSRTGLTIRKKSAAPLQIINIYSPKSTYDAIYLSNYATINIIDTTSSRRCRARTFRRPLGRVGAAPITNEQQVQITLKTKGRLSRPEEFPCSCNPEKPILRSTAP